tara:strand:- start:441 stop:713 length:273 start_codon:yes stop_codon:yes gene_type:complete
MIDTDKYEGHTRGPWKIEGAKTIIGAEDLRITVKGGTQRDKNLRLVANAPDLLAEVLRLREGMAAMHKECDDFKDLGKRLHDFMLKEMGE